MGLYLFNNVSAVCVDHLASCHLIWSTPHERCSSWVLQLSAGMRDRCRQSEKWWRGDQLTVTLLRHLRYCNFKSAVFISCSNVTSLKYTSVFQKCLKMSIFLPEVKHFISALTAPLGFEWLKWYSPKIKIREFNQKWSAFSDPKVNKRFSLFGFSHLSRVNPLHKHITVLTINHLWISVECMLCCLTVWLVIDAFWDWTSCVCL